MQLRASSFQALVAASSMVCEAVALSSAVAASFRVCKAVATLLWQLQALVVQESEAASAGVHHLP